ncbi:MAG: hypothetical protein ACOZDY_18005 [Pseudomonadota bacterium]
MAQSFLEQLAGEWYEHQGYYVRGRVRVGSGKGACDLDVVALDPLARRVVHVEAGLDAHSWPQRERHCRRKFEAARRHLPALFPSLDLAGRIDQVVLLGIASKTRHSTLAGAPVVLASELIGSIIEAFGQRRLGASAVAEHHVILRTLHYIAEYRRQVFRDLS